MAKVKITNTLTKIIANGDDKPTFISPSGVTNPCTPYQEYISDMATLTDGTLGVPAYNKVQIIKVPINGYIEFEITDYKEISYYENLKIEGAKVEVTDGITTVVEENSGSDSEGTGDETSDTYELLESAPEDWATNYTNYFTKNGDEYVAVTGDSAPTFAENTYYKKVSA